MPDALLLTCEHGGNRVPRSHAGLFAGRERLLDSHRGWDPGALELARTLSRVLHAPLIAATTTRLLVDLNRSPGNPDVFSRWTAALSDAERATLLATHHAPHHAKALDAVTTLLRDARRVIHVGVHTFTPILRGVRRTVDIGVLFDPARPHERAFGQRWRQTLERALPRLRIAENQPYRGDSDGLPTILRDTFPATRYLGLEIEVNHRFARRGGPAWTALQRAIADSLTHVLRDARSA